LKKIRKAYNMNRFELRGKCVKSLKIYLETSVFNFVFAEDSPERRHDAVLNQIKTQKTLLINMYLRK